MLPLLLLIVFGIVDFGRMLNQQIMLTEAAREIVRPAALRQPTRPQVAVSDGRRRVAPSGAARRPSPTCPAGTATARSPCPSPSQFLTPVGAIADLIGSSTVGTDITMTGIGAMRCS